VQLGNAAVNGAGFGFGASIASNVVNKSELCSLVRDHANSQFSDNVLTTCVCSSFNHVYIFYRSKQDLCSGRCALRGLLRKSYAEGGNIILDHYMTVGRKSVLVRSAGGVFECIVR